MDPRQEELRRRLTALGFDDVRFAKLATPDGGACPPGSNEALHAWLAAGMHGEMQWMERSAEKRVNAGHVLPGARSIIMLGVNYWTTEQGAPREARGLERVETAGRRTNPVWARYAVYEDYHDTMKPGLVAAGRALEELYGVTGLDYRYYVDTGPMLERAWAAEAGLGFVGKNAMLISRRHGNWLFLAGILTRIEFEPDEPIRRQFGERDIGLLCGKCTRCLDACPTDAFAAPGVVDARRCISYQTIENKGIIPRELRAAIGNRIYGCDVCLDVCPWNRFAQDGRRLLLSARHDLPGLTLAEILELTPERFAQVFRRTPIKRLKLVGLLRNACIVAGNSGDPTLLPQLVALATTHALPLVRAHAVWAVHRLCGGTPLVDAHQHEMDPLVLAEYAAEARSSRRKEADDR